MLFHFSAQSQINTVLFFVKQFTHLFSREKNARVINTVKFTPWNLIYFIGRDIKSHYALQNILRKSDTFFNYEKLITMCLDIATFVRLLWNSELMTPYAF